MVRTACPKAWRWETVNLQRTEVLENEDTHLDRALEACYEALNVFEKYFG